MFINNLLGRNIAGGGNTATGSAALPLNTTGSNNTATGFRVLFNNTAGPENTASGWQALMSNTIGGFNTAVGANALQSNTTGNENIAIGFRAGDAIRTGSSNIDIGAFGLAEESNTIRIGLEGTQTATFMAGIVGNILSDPGVRAVVVDSNGQLGTRAGGSSAASSGRLLKEVQKLAREINRRAAQIRTIAAQAKRKDARIAELQAQVALQERQIDTLKEKDAQIDALIERMTALERWARLSGPERLATTR